MEFVEVKSNAVWQFEKAGDKIEGELTAVEEGKFGNNYIIKAKNGESFTIFGSAVLNTNMKRVELSSYVRITYKGEVKSGSGRLYRDFKVEIGK